MKVRLIVALVVMALVAGVAYRMQSKESASATRGPGGGEARALAVKTVPVSVRDFPIVMEVPGILEAARQAAISAQTGGVLLKQHVAEGEAVRAGQVLFSLDARPAQARMAQSQASLTGARAEIDEADKTLQRLTPLTESGYISRQEYDNALLARESARARVSSAQAALEAARLEADWAVIRAPFAGRVGRITVKPGDLVAAGSTLTVLTQAGTLDARASVASQDSAALAMARAQRTVTAELYVEGVNAPVAQGALEFIDTQVDAGSGAVPVKVRLANAPAALLPGQSVRIRLTLGVEPDAKVIPEAALHHAQAGTYLYVVREGKAVLQAVEVVRALDGELAVAGTLVAGEPVLVEVPRRLRDGSDVTLEGERDRSAADTPRP